MAIFELSSISKKTKALQNLWMVFSKTTHYRGYLSKIWKNPKFHDCPLILDSKRNWLLKHTSSFVSMSCKKNCFHTSITTNNFFQVCEIASYISQTTTFLLIGDWSSTRLLPCTWRTWTTASFFVIGTTTVLVSILKKILTVQQDNRNVS